MQNPIKPNGLINTPDSTESLAEWINLHSGSELVLVATAAGMAWNLAAKLIRDEIENQQKEEETNV
jgi:hypothetical protein